MSNCLSVCLHVCPHACAHLVCIHMGMHTDPVAIEHNAVHLGGRETEYVAYSVYILRADAVWSLLLICSLPCTQPLFSTGLTATHCTCPTSKAVAGAHA